MRHAVDRERRPLRSAESCRSRCWPASGRPAPAHRRSAAPPAYRGRRPRRDRPAATAHLGQRHDRVMLGRTDDHPAPGAQRVDRQRIRLGAARGEHQILRAARQTGRPSPRARPPGPGAPHGQRHEQKTDCRSPPARRASQRVPRGAAAPWRWRPDRPWLLGCQPPVGVERNGAAHDAPRDHIGQRHALEEQLDLSAQLFPQIVRLAACRALSVLRTGLLSQRVAWVGSSTAAMMSATAIASDERASR